MNLRKNWRDYEMAKIIKFSDYVNGKGNALEAFHIQTFVYDGTRYESFISETGKKQLQNIQKSVSDAIVSKDPSIDSSKIIELANYMNAAKGVKKEISFSQLQQENGKVLTLTKTPNERRAGFINASILLYAIMNIAIIIAITVFLL